MARIETELAQARTHSSGETGPGSGDSVSSLASALERVVIAMTKSGNVAPELIKRAHSNMSDMMTSVRLLQQQTKQEQAPSAPTTAAPQNVHIGTPPRAE